MLTLLKLLQSFVKTLHSEGTPGQIAAGMALGAAIGFTPLMNLHNLVFAALLIILNVSLAGGLLAIALFTPIAFLLDPLFDLVGRALLVDNAALEPVWTTLYNIPLVPYTNFNNTVVLGSFVAWLVLAIPIYVGTRLGVTRYRETLGARVQASRWYKAIAASKAYNVYRWFRPE